MLRNISPEINAIATASIKLPTKPNGSLMVVKSNLLVKTIVWCQIGFVLGFVIVSAVDVTIGAMVDPSNFSFELPCHEAAKASTRASDASSASGVLESVAEMSIRKSAGFTCSGRP